MSQSLLKLQIGPVQDFIAQARSTRDLWSGSYLLSWLMAHALKEVIDKCGVDAVIFPAVNQQPLIQWLSNPAPDPENSPEILTPSLPNVFLAELPAEDAVALAESASNVFSAEDPDFEWAKICSACFEFLGGEKAFGEMQRQCWAFQIRNHWQVAWQIWPMLSGKELATARATFPPLLEKNAQATDWNANFQLVSHRLEARRRTRDFDAWQNPLQGHKDHFSGKEQAIIDDAWLAKAQNPADPRNLRFLFRNNDELGAVNLIKRVWHKAYLERKKRLKRARRAFDSVPDVAAAPWRELLRTKLLSPTPPEGLDAAFAEFTQAVQRVRPFLDKDYEEVQRSIPRRGDSDYKSWLEKADLAIFNQTTWETDGAEPEAKPLHEEASKRLRQLLAAAGLGDPGKYYAVLALDGDEMGKWISGRKTGGVVDKQTHHKFSAKLSEFSLSTARKIVEEDYHGQLVYAGGDDVLAILPAIEALTCAKSLMEIFRKIQIDKGQLTASVGIAFGHIKEPLQDMIAEAKEAEGRAKKDRDRGGWDRDALAITLYKRSGEMVQWGAKFESKAFELLSLFQRHYRPALDNPGEDMPISGKFPHRTVEMLAKFGLEAKIRPKLSEVAEAEMKWIIHQQTHQGSGVASKDALEKLRISLLDRCRDYLAELCGDDGDCRPLAEFYQLFAMEAFIARQRD